MIINIYIVSLRFDIGQIETANLFSSHAKISENQDEFLDFLLKINRGANANGQLKLNVKKAIGANGSFKITDSNGQGNGMIIVDFKQVGYIIPIRKHFQ